MEESASARRACLPCRAAKAKCDILQPACGRCTQRGLICAGRPAQDAVFRDQNQTAMRNSWRARNRPGQRQLLLEIRNDAGLQDREGALADIATYPLGQVPRNPGRGVEDRAVERMLVNWTLYPDSAGRSPGLMHQLPSLLHSAGRDSVLWLAVRALAYADMGRDRVEGVDVPALARQCYGGVLNRMRRLINEGREYLGTDTMLLSMLLIDNFELVHMARSSPVSPHSNAIIHMLQSTGEEQLFSPTRFSLWCLTHYRLQAWQTLMREEPDTRQIEWISRLNNVDRPDLRICSHVLQMNVLSAASKALLWGRPRDEATRLERLARARELTQEMNRLILKAEDWASEMVQVWKPKEEDPSVMAGPLEAEELIEFPIPYFPFEKIITYDDLWLGFIWTFYGASQIALRESLVDTIEYAAGLESRDSPNEEDAAIIQAQVAWIDVLCTAILEAFPQLLGFTSRQRECGRPVLDQQGRLSGRLFALFGVWVVQTAKFSSPEQKTTASEVATWIKTRHELG